MLSPKSAKILEIENVLRTSGISQEDFSSEVFDRVDEDSGIMDSILEVAEIHCIDIEDVVQFMTPLLRTKLTIECEDLRLIPESPRLPDAWF